MENKSISGLLCHKRVTIPRVDLPGYGVETDEQSSIADIDAEEYGEYLREIHDEMRRDE